MSKVEAVREMLCKFGYAIAHGDNPSAGELARRIDALYREGCPKCGETGMIDRLTTTAWRCHCGHEWSTPAEQDSTGEAQITQWACGGCGATVNGRQNYCPECGGTLTKGDKDCNGHCNCQQRGQ